MELSIGGISTSGVSNQYVQQMLLQQLDTAQSAMLATESQLSSGKQMTEGSDNPVATMQIVNLDSQLDSNAQMTNNVTANQAYLSTTDAALSNVASLLSQAQSDTLSAAGSTATSQQRSAAAAEVGEAIQELMNIGNQQFDGRYLFAGSDAAVAPFTTTANGLIQYNGNNQNIDSFSNANVMFPTNVTGAAAFSALSSPIEGANLNPELTAETPLADLREGAGVALGNIEISDGSSQPTVIDLSQAQTVGDVATMIEDNPPAGRSVQVAIGPTGLNVSLVPVAGESKTLSISDIGNGLTAKQLGIAGLSNNGAIYGGALNPTISLTTPLSALNGGAGIDQTSGLQIVGNGTTQTVSLAGCQTIQDVINALNSSGTGLVAQINSSKTGLEVYSNLSGCDFSIGENGGQTATDLGLRTFTANTPLSDLNHGAGVAAAQGDSQSFTVTAADGTAYDVSIAGLSTVGQVMSAIKTDSGGKVSAELSQYGNGIQLVDDTTSPGSVSATADPTSTAAVDLGLIPSGKSTVAGSTKGFASAAVNFGGQANSGLLIQSNMAGTAGDVQIIFQNGATLSPPVYDATNNTLTFNVVNGVTTASQARSRSGRRPDRGKRILRNPRHRRRSDQRRQRDGFHATTLRAAALRPGRHSLGPRRERRESAGGRGRLQRLVAADHRAERKRSGGDPAQRDAVAAGLAEPEPHAGEPGRGRTNAQFRANATHLAEHAVAIAVVQQSGRRHGHGHFRTHRPTGRLPSVLADDGANVQDDVAELSVLNGQPTRRSSGRPSSRPPWAAACREAPPSPACRDAGSCRLRSA